MIDVRVIEQTLSHAHIQFTYDEELGECWRRACEYQTLVLEYKLYKNCWVILEDNFVHCIANNTGDIDQEKWVLRASSV